MEFLTGVGIFLYPPDMETSIFVTDEQGQDVDINLQLPVAVSDESIHSHDNKQ